MDWVRERREYGRGTTIDDHHDEEEEKKMENRINSSVHHVPQADNSAS